MVIRELLSKCVDYALDSGNKGIVSVIGRAVDGDTQCSCLDDEVYDEEIEIFVRKQFGGNVPHYIQNFLDRFGDGRDENRVPGLTK